MKESRRRTTAASKETTEPSASEASDAKLLRLIAAGDGSAFGELADRLGPVLKRVLYRLGLSEPEVEDVAQETLVRIWRGSASFKEQSSVSTWACRIAINQGISLIRSRRPVPADISEPHADPQVELEKRQTAAVVRSAVIELPVGLRAVIILREFEDMTYRSIAEVLEIPVGTVMSRLHEARLRLRLKLISSSSE